MRSKSSVDREEASGDPSNLVGDTERSFGAEEGTRVLRGRAPRTDLRPHPALPDDTRLWAALVHASGGVWGGCVYDADRIVVRLEELCAEAGVLGILPGLVGVMQATEVIKLILGKSEPLIEADHLAGRCAQHALPRA